MSQGFIADDLLLLSWDVPVRLFDKDDIRNWQDSLCLGTQRNDQMKADRPERCSTLFSAWTPPSHWPVTARTLTCSSPAPTSGPSGTSGLSQRSDSHNFTHESIKSDSSHSHDVYFKMPSRQMEMARADQELRGRQRRPSCSPDKFGVNRWRHTLHIIISIIPKVVLSP